MRSVGLLLVFTLITGLVAACSASPDRPPAVKRPGGVPRLQLVIFPQRLRSTGPRPGGTAPLTTVVGPLLFSQFDLASVDWLERRMTLSIDASQRVPDHALTLGGCRYVLALGNRVLLNGRIHLSISAMAPPAGPYLIISDFDRISASATTFGADFALEFREDMNRGLYQPAPIPALTRAEDLALGAYLERVVNGHLIALHALQRRR